MPIDINNINNSTQTKRTVEQKHVKVVSKGSDNSAAAGSDNRAVVQDSVNLTGSATRIKALEEQVARLPIVDTQKVEEIRNAINNGTFEFNSDRIAEKMIQFENDLL